MNYVDKMNHYASKNTPYIFILPYDKSEEEIVVPIEEAYKMGIFFKINNFCNYPRSDKKMPEQSKITIKIKSPVSYDDYLKKFNELKTQFIKGNTFLTNLTVKTEIETNSTMEDIFFSANSQYKLYIKDKLTVFSPETFIKTDDKYIYTYPMKGTINANITDAAKILLEDEKEFAEHITVVDLLRNDIGIIADSISVDKFRYIIPVVKPDFSLLQTVSEIKGVIRNEFRNKPGDMISLLLPAGSITGAPKIKTVNIIGEIENYKRGYYTGVAGIWQNGNIDSFVLIRYIEKEKDRFYYKSGGGITIYSTPEKEYQEIMEKIYVPIY